MRRRPSGEGGIRTLDGGIHPHNALAGRRLQPLGHFSGTRMVSHGPVRKSPFGGMLGSAGGNRHVGAGFPPYFPRQLRRPFSAATGSGRYFFAWARGGRPQGLRCRNDEHGNRGRPRDLPELALVCPELRAQALTLLPTLDPDELFTIEPPPPARIAGAAAARPRRAKSPERLLSSRSGPRPRPVALAAYTTEALLLGALRCLAFTTVIAVAAFALSW